jgi:ribosomal protein L11 methylase PrmA
MAEIILIILGILMAFTVLVMTFALFTGAASFRTGGAVFTTTHSSKIETILDTVPMNPGLAVYDLGCGDGRFLISAEQRYGVKAVGFEINPWAFLLSKLRKLLTRSHVSINYKDFWKADLRDADIIFCYLFPDVMDRLREKLSNELRPGARVISCNFEIPGWRPETVVKASHHIHTDPIFVYQFQPGARR